MRCNRIRWFTSLRISLCACTCATAALLCAENLRAADPPAVAPREQAAEPNTRDDAAPQHAKPQRPRGGQRGMPLPPDWPRAGGFGSGREQPLLEGLVVGEMMNGEFGRRELTDDDVARVVAVAKLVSDEWGSVLEARAKSDPAQLRASLRAGGRRLLGLVALQERAPEVFKAKVAELRAEAVTSHAASELLRARDAAAAEATQIAKLETTLDTAIALQVEATLAMRAAEYEALATRLAKLKSDIDEDAKDRAKLAAEAKARALKPRVPSNNDGSARSE